MSGPRGVASGVRFKVFLAVVATLIALTAIAATALRATRSATAGADRVEREFAERVYSDAALLAATENLSLAELRVRSTTRRGVARMDGRIAASDARLARAIDIALGPGRIQEAEVARAGRIRVTYAGYMRRRGVLLSPAILARADRQSAAVERLRQGFAPFRAALTAYTDIHFAEANRALRKLEDAGRVRNTVLVVTVAFGVMSLLAIATVGWGIVSRVRTYRDFARHVARGDLSTRLHPRGSDELSGLGDSLNEMVEQLATAARDREELQRNELAYRETQDGFAELLQVAHREHEALDLLKGYIERCIPGAGVVVLDREMDEDAVHAATGLPEDSPMREPLEVGYGRSCVAVRLTRPHTSDAQARPLLACEICGGAAQRTTCVPLMASGSAIGSVLVHHEEPLSEVQARHLHDSVAQAAPVLANLRNLALAERRAATDALTGLPNRRSVQAELARMMAHAARRKSSLAAVMVDLDHFKLINDTFGHDEGDRVLAAVAAALAATVRNSDLVGRTGGEEFIVLLPDSDAAAALEVAEKLRLAVTRLSVAGMQHPITASFGVAVHPDVAPDADALLRYADQALYSAKAGGRNRVELAVEAAVAAAGSAEKPVSARSSGLVATDPHHHDGADPRIATDPLHEAQRQPRFRPRS